MKGISLYLMTVLQQDIMALAFLYLIISILPSIHAAWGPQNHNSTAKEEIGQINICKTEAHSRLTTDQGYLKKESNKNGGT